MKVRNFLAMMTIAFCAMGVVSCGDDDDDEDLPAAGEIVKGDYVGTNVLVVGGSEMPSENNVAKIIPQANGMVTVVLPQPQEAPEATSRAGMEMPLITLKDIKISEADQNTYTLSPDTIDVVSGQMHIVGKFLSGEVKNNELKLKYNFKPGKMPLYLDGSFTGSKQVK